MTKDLKERILEIADKIARLGNEPNFGNSFGNDLGKELLTLLQDPNVFVGRWESIESAPIDKWCLLDVSGEVVRSINKKGGMSGISYWFPHDPENRSAFTWANDMITAWADLPTPPAEAIKHDH